MASPYQIYRQALKDNNKQVVQHNRQIAQYNEENPDDEKEFEPLASMNFTKKRPSNVAKKIIERYETEILTLNYMEEEVTLGNVLDIAEILRERKVKTKPVVRRKTSKKNKTFANRKA